MIIFEKEMIGNNIVVFFRFDLVCVFGFVKEESQFCIFVGIIFGGMGGDS
jgi:hypothetical protein